MNSSGVCAMSTHYSSLIRPNHGEQWLYLSSTCLAHLLFSKINQNLVLVSNHGRQEREREREVGGDNLKDG